MSEQSSFCSNYDSHFNIASMGRFPHMKSLQCYALTRRYSRIPKSAGFAIDLCYIYKYMSQLLQVEPSTLMR